MPPWSWTIAWYAFLLVMLWAFQRLTKWSTQLNIFSVFSGFFLLRHGLTVPLDHTLNQWYTGVTLTPLAFTRFYTSLVLMWVCVYLGALGARAFLGRVDLPPETLRADLRRGNLPDGINGLFLIGLFVVLGLIAIYQLRIDATFWD